MKLKKIIFFTIILSLCVLPFLSFAQGSITGVQSQILPNNGEGLLVGSDSQINTDPAKGSITGVQSQILPNNGEGLLVGSDSQINTDPASSTIGNQAGSSGSVVGNQANFSSTGIFCSLQLHPTFGILLKYITCILSSYIIPLIFSLAITIFIFGVVQYVINTDNEEKKMKAKAFMIWGIASLAIMVSVWGLVRIFGNTFGIKTSVFPSLNEKSNP